MKNISCNLIQKITILGIVVAMLISFGCVKEKELTANIRTVNAADGTVVPSANIVLISKADSIYLKDGSAHSVSGITDADGKYSIEFKLESIVPIHAWKVNITTSMLQVGTKLHYPYTVLAPGDTIKTYEPVYKKFQITDSLAGNGSIRFDPQQKDRHRIDTETIKLHVTYHNVVEIP